MSPAGQRASEDPARYYQNVKLHGMEQDAAAQAAMMAMQPPMEAAAPPPEENAAPPA